VEWLRIPQINVLESPIRINIDAMLFRLRSNKLGTIII
jgi:hypothetical protein